MTRSAPQLALCLLLLVGAVAPVITTTSTATATAAMASQSECETVVTHDAYRFDDGTINATVNGSGSSTVLNTKTTVEDATGFVRITGANPNGYCVRFVVELAREVVAPAALGEIDATDSNVTAAWRAVHEFNSSSTFTRVTFTLPPATKATFAPSKARVAALEWTGTATDVGSGIFGNVSVLDDEQPDLQKRHYRFSPETNGTTIITVPLENRGGNRTISEYHALYKTSNESGWKPIGTDSGDPVFKRELDGGDAVQFQFNDPDAEVKFTANPDRFEQAKYSWEKYSAGVEWFDDLFGGDDGDGWF